MAAMIPESALDFIAKHEGLRLTAYPDPASPLAGEKRKLAAQRAAGWEKLSGDPWTVGYGHTGPDVTPGLKITLAQARDMLRRDLEVAAGRLKARLKPAILARLTENQTTALLSFVFNLGANPKWAIWKVLNAGQFEAVPAQLRRFVYAQGRKLNGLVERRAAESALFASGIPSQEVSFVSLPSSVTREIDTPPEPFPTKPLAKSKSFMTACATGVATASVAVGEVSRAVNPFAAQSDFVGRAVSVLAILSAALAVGAIFFAWLKKRNATL